jgi:hypothetical protein
MIDRTGFAGLVSFESTARRISLERHPGVFNSL